MDEQAGRVGGTPTCFWKRSAPRFSAWPWPGGVPPPVPPAPRRALVLATGVAGALFGAFVMNTALDAGNLLTMLLGAAIVSTASLSLLLRPAGRLRHSATA